MSANFLTKILFLSFTLNLITSQTTSSPTDLNLWPKPKSYTQGNTTITISSQSTLIFNVLASSSNTTQEQYIMQLINIYKGIIFNKTSIDFEIYINGKQLQKSEKASIEQHLLTISINNPFTMISEQVSDEQYNISITKNTTWYLNCSTYAAFSRAIETFSQLINYNSSEGVWQIVSTPISINDQPEFFYRCSFIYQQQFYYSNNARYSSPLPLCPNTSKRNRWVNFSFQNCLSIMYNKLNTLHWHISDAETFPWVLNSYPNLTAYAIYNKTSHYTSADVKQIIEYAKVRGVRIVPEIDSPGHSYCWGKSPELSNIALLCDHLGNGQIDPTLNLTWEVVTGILTDINTAFPDSLVHFGGDEVEGWCWDQRPSIATWMSEHNMTEHSELELYYKQREKSIWKGLSNRSVIYWENANLNLKSEPSDIIQWWGKTSQLSTIQNLTNRIILSNSEELYLDHFDITWENVFNFTPIITGIKGTIIGAEAPLWAELNDDFTTEEKLWVRATALSERLWNTATKNTSTFADIVRRINGAQMRMTQRGLKPRPCEKQLCASDPYFCYGIATFQECTADPWCYRNSLLNDDNQEQLIGLKEQNLLENYLKRPEKKQ